MKKKIKKILVALDGSKNSLRGLDMAINQAQVTGATITGIYVFPHRYEMYYWRKNDVNSEFKKNSSKIMKAAKNHTKKLVKFKENITMGEPGSTITKFASANKFDLIVIGARGLSSINEAFLGSTSHYVIHKTKIPVLLVK